MKKLTGTLTVLLFTFIFTAGAKADVGDLFVQVDLENGSGGCSILQVKPNGALINAVPNAQILATTGFGSADCSDTGLAINNNGDIFFTEDTSDSILKFDQSTGVLSTFVTEAQVTAVTGATTADFDNGLAFGPSGTLFAADEQSDSIVSINPSGVVSLFITEAELAAATGNSGVDLQGGIAVDEDGNLYIADDTSDSVLKVTPSRNVSVLTTATQIQAVTGFDPDLDVGVLLREALFVLDDANCGCLLKIDIMTGVPELLVSATQITAVTGNTNSDPEGGIAMNFNGEILIGDDGFNGANDVPNILTVPPAGTVGIFVSENQLTNFYNTAEPGFSSFRLLGSMSIEGFADTTRAIPTLSEWGLIAMALALGMIGFIVIRKRTVKA